MHDGSNHSKKNKFPSRKPTKAKQVPQYGSLKGTFTMRDDFDEPLDDFQDYV